MTYCPYIYIHTNQNQTMLDFHWKPIGFVVTTCSGFGFSQKFDDIGNECIQLWVIRMGVAVKLHALFIVGFLVGWSHFSFPYRGQALPRYRSRGCSYLFTPLPLVPAVLRCSAVNHYHIQNSVPSPERFIWTVLSNDCALACVSLQKILITL